MAVTFTGSDTTYLTPSGGRRIELYGLWPLATPIAVRIGPATAVTDRLAWSGVPGTPYACYAVSAQKLVCFAPRIDPGPQSVGLWILVNGTDLYTSPGRFLVRPAQFHSLTYALRGTLPPKWAVGPRRIDLEVPA